MHGIEEVAERVGVKRRRAKVPAVHLDHAEHDEQVVVDGQAGQQPVEDAPHLRTEKRIVCK